VKKFLKPIHVGPVESYVDHEMNKDFRKLKETAIKMVGLILTNLYSDRKLVKYL
jgi:hypothetical protein